MVQHVPKNLAPQKLHSWLNTNASNLVLVDVREDEELVLAPFPSQVIHLPLSKASVWVQELPERLGKTQPVVVICHSGVRSWNFATWLLEQGWGNEVWNLEGGIDAWSVNVDPNVPRY
ncbi:rhodanese-like domain-containing protein [Prochlorococcus sp. MIT 1307]|uniref:rhodanese-like domain-containing protein n=1 Tax=Prochlorococcus sp. MIT 1307 TaxID=3096219 RepID=UPI002A764728|nr:rhodanese-like domain-containing protein [Prochlorococcus sp. MIT 1307]